MTYQPRLHVVLYQPEIPQNTGNVGRTCVAVGAKLWLVRPLGFQLDDHHLRRAGLDYWQHLQWEVVEDWRTLCDALPPERAWFYSKSGQRSYVQAPLKPGDVLVFGGESQGLPRRMLETYPDRSLMIPIRPQVRSLNLSNAVAIAVYEAMRQWDRPEGSVTSL